MSTVTINKEFGQFNFPEFLDKTTKYPDIRFYCPFCGSLDVYLNTNESTKILSVCCLDCEKKWKRVKN